MTRTVDLHHHAIPDFYWEASNEDGNAAGGITPPRWSLEGAIAYLDEARIDAAVPSISTPGVHFGDDAAARTLARKVNEYLADLRRDRPDRFGAFATLPLPDIEGSLNEIAHAIEVLELDGVALLTNADGSYLGDARFDPIFAELQRRAAVVFVHPTASPDAIAHTLDLPDSLLDYPVDTSRAIAKLHYSNTFARTPDVKYLFAHAGGTIPFVASRFAIVDEMDVIPGAQERGAFGDALPRLYWDTASAFSDPVLHMLRSVTGIGNVVFGTDYPYPRDAISIAGLRQLQHTAELDESERRGVLGGSAARLIPRLAGGSESLSPVGRAHAIFAAFDAKDIAGLAAMMTDDVRLQLGNADPVEGKSAFVEALQTFFASVARFRHVVTNVWSDRDALIAELEVHYTRLDGAELTLPVCNVFRLRDGSVADYRVYMDIAPVYA
jgi:6-methylsalicylate decarboxylase